MLHVTNGDIAVERIASLGVPGEVLAWRDVLHDGPVRGDLDAEGLRQSRAEFLSGAFGVSSEVVVSQFQRRDTRLERAIRSEELLLWFEPDLYDQLQLLQVLDACPSDESVSAPQLVPLRTHFGVAADTELQAAWEARHPVSPREREFASRAWSCFRSEDPTTLEAIANDRRTGLPHVAGAIRRLLEEYPSRLRGLARSEAQLLDAIAGAAKTAAEAFRASADREEHVYLGDASFAGYLRRLGAGARPVVRFADGQPISAADPAEIRGGFWQAPLEITSTGRAVLHGELYRAEVLPFDHWIGGVHLHGANPKWRRDEAGRVFQSS
ncbi:MAG: hypothetical protein P8125_04280 [Gemmatimonadota bacterium]|jgi:hypothetical protein